MTFGVRSVGDTFENALSKETHGISTDDRPRLNILDGDATRRDHRTFADCDARPYERLGANPGRGADVDRSYDQRHRRIGDIVRCPA